jgi:hypothetical protein
VVFRNQSRVDVILAALLVGVGVADVSQGFWLGLLLVVLGVFNVVQSRRTAVEVTDEDLVIRSLLGTRRLAWFEVAGAQCQRVMWSRRLDVVETGGRVRRVRLSGLLDRRGGPEEAAAVAINERAGRPKPKTKPKVRRKRH